MATIKENNILDEHLIFHKKGVGVCLTIYSGKDEETGSFVAFIPSLSISGYGKTEEEADEMLKDSSKDYIKSLLGLSAKHRNID